MKHAMLVSCTRDPLGRIGATRRVAGTLIVVAAITLAGCGASGRQPDVKAEAPPAATVEHEADANLVKVDHPDLFPVATAAARTTTTELNVTGVVSADVSRTMPVISLTSGRVVEIRARLGDEVVKGQLLMRVQSAEVSGAFSDYRKATTDEALARTQLDRAKLLYEKGAAAAKDLEVAQDTADKAKVDVENAMERLKVLGADPLHPSSVIDIVAPVSGVITEQNVTASAGVKTLDNSPNLFTIADLSEVWVIGDVYENDLRNVRIGERAEIHPNAYPNRVLQAKVSNIGASLDPNIRTAKVRLEVHNPGILRLGMFVTATFHGQDKHTTAVVPASAILHLHDRDWAYVPAEGNTFRRVEVTAGKMVPPNLQEVLSGIAPGGRVVTNALVLQNTAEQ